MVFRIARSTPDLNDKDKEILLGIHGKTHLLESKKMGFYLSRQALFDASRTYYPEIKINELELENFSGFKRFPDLTLSISHTEEAGAAVVSSKNEHKSLGIDIENASRVPTESVLARIRNLKDINLAPIEIWVIKEAIYKCSINSGSVKGHLGFSQIEVSSPTHWNIPTQNLNGQIEIKNIDEFIVGLASIKT